MKILDQKEEHWALGREFTCVKCQTRQVIDCLDDFFVYNGKRIDAYCGRCGNSNSLLRIPNAYTEINKAMEDIDMSVPLTKTRKRGILW